MSLSTGARSLIGQIASWTAAAAVVVVSILYFDDLRRLVAASLPGHVIMAEENDGGRKPKTADEEAARSDRTVEIRASSNGHFHARAEINGRPVDVMVDTGATIVALTWEDASRAGIFLTDSDFTHRVSTANGIARVAPITLDRVSIEDITVRNVRAAVTEPGKLTTTLLGMSFLGQLARAEMRKGVLILQE